MPSITPTITGPIITPATRWARPLSLLAAILTVLSQLLRLADGLLGSDSAATVTHTLIYALSLLGMGTLMLALTALYAVGRGAMGKRGLIGYLAAFLGTLLVAGDWWFEAFVVPTIDERAPDLLDGTIGGSILAGAVATIALYSIGWVLFGLASLRAQTMPRPAAALLIVGGLVGPLALTTPYQIPLAVGIGWAGLAMKRDAPGSQRLPASR